MITQKDIAERLGVSPSLVSRALRGTAESIGAAQETIERICAEADRLSYKPNAAALSLRGNSTRTIAAAVKDFEDPFFGSMIGELQRLAKTMDYSLALAGCGHGRDPDESATYLLKYQPDGLILAGSDLDNVDVQPFVERGIPIVQIGTGDAIDGTSRVAANESMIAELLVDYLAGLGHRQIGFIANARTLHTRRIALTRKALTACGLPVEDRWFFQTSSLHPEAGYEAMHSLLRQSEARRPSAVIGADDSIAQAGLRALFENSLRIPRDVSVAGVDDLASSRWSIPSLTTVRLPIREMAQKAFGMLIDAGNRSGKRSIVTAEVRPELIIRESCGSPHERL